MRTIEKEMLQAIKDKKNWQKSNSSVYYSTSAHKDSKDMSQVFLFGNHIGTFFHGIGKFDTNIRTLIDWPSVTTKSRLRAIGVNLVSKKGNLYIDDKPIVELLK